MAAPVRKGEELELRIDSLAYGGSGVARHDGFVVFVRGGLPGDDVRARVTKVKRGFAEGVVSELVEPSTRRVDAPCRHFGVCGGCRFQDLAYEVQVAEKERQVRDALVRIGRFADPPLEPIVPAESQYRLPQQARVLVHDDRRRRRSRLPPRRALGRGDRHRGVPADDGGRATRSGSRFATWAREERLEPYDQATGTGYLRHLVVREGRNTGQALVVLVTAPGERFETGYFVDVLRRFPEVRSIHWAINDTPAEQTNLPTKLLWGDEAIEEEILGLRFRVRPSAFLQTNTEMAARLYELAREYARLTGSENVFDLYCGTGTIGLSLASGARAVWGLEISEEAVACAIENAELNGIENAQLLRGKRRSDDRGAARGGRRPRRRRRRSAPRGAGGEGATADGSARRAEDRLRLVQPDDARVGPAGATRRVRLRARALPSGRHVPAHAARGVGLRAGQDSLVSVTDVGRLTSRRRTSRQRRSAFGTRKPRHTAGSAGSPATLSHDQTSASVTARQAVIPIQVAATRSPKRPAAARNSAKKTTSGGPRFTVAVSPGLGNAIATFSKIPGRSSTTYSVGPAATDQMSTHGTSTATRVIHHSSSNSVRNQKPKSA